MIGGMGRSSRIDRIGRGCDYVVNSDVGADLGGLVT